VETTSEEHALIAAQDAFPYGTARAVVSNAELEEGDQARIQANRKRAADDQSLKEL
jgi:hypothetical protein